MVHYFVITIALLTCFTRFAEARDVVFTRAFAGSEYGYYHREVLARALKVTPEYGAVTLTPHSHPMPQARQILTLQKSEADVMWSVTSDERETQLIAVKLPLLKGLAGYRVFIIGQQAQDNFPASLTLAQLKQKVGIQGKDWPDYAILKGQGFKVEASDWSEWYTSMFNMVERGAVDYFPRNIIEVHRDLNRHTKKALMLERHHLLHYPNYEYFFVRPDAPLLAERLSVGLARMIASGDLESLFMAHENHRQAMTLLGDDKRIVHEVSNPTLSYSLDYARWDLNPARAVNALTATSQPSSLRLPAAND